MSRIDQCQPLYKLRNVQYACKINELKNNNFFCQTYLNFEILPHLHHKNDYNSAPDQDTQV